MHIIQRPFTGGGVEEFGAQAGNPEMGPSVPAVPIEALVPELSDIGIADVKPHIVLLF